MAKNLSSLWLKSVVRLGKAQQAQGSKLIKSLLPKSLKVPSVQLIKPFKLGNLLKAAVRPKAVKARRKPTVAPALKVPALPTLPGMWQKFCFTLPDAPLMSTRQSMHCWLYLPLSASVPNAAPRPLVIMLHGCKQTATDFAISTRMNKLAERKGFAVLYPQQSIGADAHGCWHWYKRTTQQGLGDVKLIAAIIAQVQRSYGLDMTRTYVAGLSAGAGLANILAFRHPQLIAAVGLHSGPVFGTTDSPISGYRAMQHGSNPAHCETACSFVKAQPQFPGMPVILIHGDRDSVVRHVNVEQLSQQFLIVNKALITSAKPDHSNHPARIGGRSPHHAYKTETYYAGRKPQVVRYEISALGHAWSGGDNSVPFSVREGPDASLLMWTFFARHQRTPIVRKP